MRSLRWLAPVGFTILSLAVRLTAFDASAATVKQLPCSSPGYTDRVAGLVRDGSAPPEAGLAPLPSAKVRLRELGLETVTDSEGNYVFCGLNLSAPRLVTLLADKEGYGTYTVMNYVVLPDGAWHMTLSLYRDGLALSEDFCALEDGPAVSAAHGYYRDLPCRQLGAGPQWWLRDCKPHALRQHTGPGGGPLVGITGIVLESATGAAVQGATIAVPGYGVAATSDGKGCFGFEPLELRPGPSSAMLIDIQVTADGYRPLTLRHVPLFFNLGIDVLLEPGAVPQVIDKCVLSSAPASPRERALAGLCQQEGSFVQLPAGGGAPVARNDPVPRLLLFSGLGILVAALGAAFMATARRRR